MSKIKEIRLSGNGPAPTCTSFHPIQMTADIQQNALFWQQHFDFSPIFSIDWYVHLQRAQTPELNMAVIAADHDTIPQAARQAIAGLLPNLEVIDVDAAHDRLRQAGLPILQAARDEAFGQRHFILLPPPPMAC